MGYVEVTNTFATSALVDADQVNQNFEDITTGFNDGTKDHSIATLSATGMTCNDTMTIGGKALRIVTYSTSAEPDQEFRITADTWFSDANILLTLGTFFVDGTTYSIPISYAGPNGGAVITECGIQISGNEITGTLATTETSGVLHLTFFILV